MIELMAEIERLRKAAGMLNTPRDIEVGFVHRFHGVVTCHECGAKIEVSDQPFSRSPTPQTPASDHAKPDAGPSVDPTVADATAPASDAPPANVVPLSPKVTYRDGISASAFHSQVINGREATPLKRDQSDHYRSDAAERDRHPYLNRPAHKLPEVN